MRDQFTADSILLDRALGFWILRAHQALRQELYRVFHAAGEELTPEQWAVLVRLWEREGRPQHELAETTLRDRPTLSRILDGLEARGLVERRPDPDDGRGRLVYPTAAGRRLRTRLVPLARAIVERAIAGIADEDLEGMRRTLMRIVANIEKENEQP